MDEAITRSSKKNVLLLAIRRSFLKRTVFIGNVFQTPDVLNCTRDYKGPKGPGID